MDFIGSKKRLLDWIFNTIKTHTGCVEGLKFLDGCAGSGAVSLTAAAEGMDVVSNDILTFPSVIVQGASQFSDKDSLYIQYYLKRAEEFPPTQGFFYNNYSYSAGRLYFTDENASRIDSYRTFIDTIENGSLRNYLLFCLLEATSRVSNTTGVQAAFLKTIKKCAADPIILREEPHFRSSYAIKTFSMPIEKLLETFPNDGILYIDPPYNNRQYGPNYHLYETLVLNDNPKLVSKIAGLRDWSPSKSNFCSRASIKSSLHNILFFSKAWLILFSYNSDGLLTKDEFVEVIKTTLPSSKLEVLEMPIKRYKADNGRKNNDTELNEYLFVIRRTHC